MQSTDSQHAYLEVKGITKRYFTADHQPVTVLERFDLKVDKGETISVFGPNGCGKSTLLAAIADTTSLDAGSILINGKHPRDARIGFVFQKYADSLLPWLTNVDNIGLSLEHSTRLRSVRRAKVKDFFVGLGLESFPLSHYPYQCSAGQQQLVAFIRELIFRPEIFLMDEPFASLDYERRLAQHQELNRLWQFSPVTSVLVSHDMDEAIFLADRLLLFSRRPATIVASFDIDLPRPRTVEMLTSEHFLSLKRPIMNEFLKVIGR